MKNEYDYPGKAQNLYEALEISAKESAAVEDFIAENFEELAQHSRVINGVKCSLYPTRASLAMVTLAQRVTTWLARSGFPPPPSLRNKESKK